MLKLPRLTAILCLTIVPLGAADAPLEEDIRAPAEFHEVRDAILRGLERGLAPSVAVAVLKDDRLVWAEGFGYADLESRTRATANSIYRLASISKPITATGLMILVDRGLVDLDAPANRHLGAAKLRNPFGSAGEITVRRLANHTSGLPLHYNFFYDGVAPPNMDETIRRYGFAATRPGQRWEYSNLAFGILDHLVATVSDRSWRAFMDEEVYDRCGMTRTSDRVRPEREADRTVGYRPGIGGEFVPVPHYAFDHPGASAVWSSARDLMRFVRMHWNDGVLDGVRVLSEASARAMRARTSRRSLTDASGTGVGWSVERHRGRESISHSGGMPGVSTMLRAYPEARCAFAVLTNVSGRALTREVSEGIAAVLFPDAGAAADEAAAAAAEPTAARTLVDFAGEWTGTMEHADGVVRVELVVEVEAGLDDELDGEARVRFNDRRARRLENLRVASGERLFGSTTGTLATRPGYHGTPRLELRLDLDGAPSGGSSGEGGRLTGVIVAFGDGYFALSHWVDLKRGSPGAK